MLYCYISSVWNSEMKCDSACGNFCVDPCFIAIYLVILNNAELSANCTAELSAICSAELSANCSAELVESCTVELCRFDPNVFKGERKPS